MEPTPILTQAQQEVADTGVLTFPTRRKLWQTLGPWTERCETDVSPLSEPAKKRAKLALACAKKVSKIWSAYAPEDHALQTLLQQANACLTGKLPAETLYQTWRAADYMHQTEEERYSSAPMAAIAAERAAAAVLFDEPLLDPRYDGTDETGLDPYDYDAAWCAALAWAGQDEEATPGAQRAAELKFWAWYLEQYAKLWGLEGWRFPKKAIRAFMDKQELSRPVPEEVTLESLADFLCQGDYRFHYRIRNAFGDGTIFGDEDHGYDLYTISRGREGVCPKCGTRVSRSHFWYTVNALEALLPGTKVSLRVLHTLPMFHCPHHPDASFVPKSESEYVNPKAALKRYLEGPGRLQALLDQLEGRKKDVFEIGGGYLALNGHISYHLAVSIPSRVKGIRWLSREPKQLEIDLKRFGPGVYFDYLTLEEYRAVYPEQTQVLEDGSIQIQMKRHSVRCWLDRGGGLERVVIT